MPDTIDTSRVALIDALNVDLQRKANDLMGYVVESTPYVPRGDEHILECIRKLVAIEQDNAESLSSAVTLLGGIPSPGCWDLGVADINYLNVRFVAREVISHLEESIRLIDVHITLAADYPKVAALLHAVRDDTRFQIEQIQESLARKPEAKKAANGSAASPGDTAGAPKATRPTVTRAEVPVKAEAPAKSAPPTPKQAAPPLPPAVAVPAAKAPEVVAAKPAEKPAPKPAEVAAAPPVPAAPAAVAPSKAPAPPPPAASSSAMAGGKKKKKNKSGGPKPPQGGK